jgi:hypothetical protein
MKAKCLLIGAAVLFIVGLLTASSYAKIDPKTCVGMWLFDKGSGKIAEDLSNNKNDGTFFGDPEWKKGKFDGALEFDGDDRVIVPSSASIKSTMEGLTVVSWVYPTKEADNGNIVEVNANSGWRIRVFNGGPQGNAAFFDRGATNCFAAGKTTPVNKWLHLAATGSKNGIIIYIDGERAGSTNNPYAPDPGNDDLSIGGCNEFANEYFVGLIDEVGIFNVALEDGDIKSIMEKGLRVALSGGSAVFSADRLAATWGNIKAQ